MAIDLTKNLTINPSDYLEIKKNNRRYVVVRDKDLIGIKLHDWILINGDLRFNIMADFNKERTFEVVAFAKGIEGLKEGYTILSIYKLFNN